MSGSCASCRDSEAGLSLSLAVLKNPLPCQHPHLMIVLLQGPPGSHTFSSLCQISRYLWLYSAPIPLPSETDFLSQHAGLSHTHKVPLYRHTQPPRVQPNPVWHTDFHSRLLTISSKLYQDRNLRIDASLEILGRLAPSVPVLAGNTWLDLSGPV